MTAKRITAILLLAMLLAGTFGCAPGNERWAPENARANFWAGLWHGMIVVIVFVVSWFTDQVTLYETNNVGFWYNLGYVLGLMLSLGGGLRIGTHRRSKARARSKPDWDKLGLRIEAGVKEGVHEAFKDQDIKPDDADWEELGRRIRERIKEELGNWDKED